MDWKFISIFVLAAIQTLYTILGFYQHRPLTMNAKQYPRIIMAVLMLLTWAAVGFDLYDRPPTLPLIVESSGRMQFRNTELTDVRGRNYLNETVILDGKRFLGCTFDSVTFYYEGTAPFEIGGNQFIRHDGTLRWRIGSHNPSIQQALIFLDQMGYAAPNHLPAEQYPDPPDPLAPTP